MKAFMRDVILTRQTVTERIEFRQSEPDVEAIEVVSTGVKSDFTPTLQVSQKKNLSPKLVLAIEWLLSHPEDMTESVRKIASKLDISHTWVAQAKKLIESGEYQETLNS